MAGKGGSGQLAFSNEKGCTVQLVKPRGLHGNERERCSSLGWTISGGGDVQSKFFARPKKTELGEERGREGERERGRERTEIE